MPKKTKEFYSNVTFELDVNEKRPIDVSGRACYRVPAKTLPDDIVMNEVLYPAAEIAKGYETLENTAAPLGHPKVDRWYVSASDPEGINRHWCGAWNANVRRVLEDNGKYRIHHDIYIDIETAKQSDNGRRVLNAFEKRKPIHTSTGVYCNAEYAGEEGRNNGYEWIARNIELDHNAILLDEMGAGTPEDGVGVFVNRSRDEKKHLTINSLYCKEKILGDLITTNYTENTNEGNSPMTTPAKDKKPEVTEGKTNEKVEATPAVAKSEPAPTSTTNADQITLSKSDLAELVASSVKTALAERDELNAANEKAELVSKIVAVNLLSKESAEKLDVATLRELSKSTGVKSNADAISGKPNTGEGEFSIDKLFADYNYNDAGKEETPTQH